MTRAPRLAMLTLPGLDHFTADLIARLPAASGWEVRPFMTTTREDLAQALCWAGDPSRDAVWFEFCWPPFPAMIAATDFQGRRVIVRVHRIEATEAPYVAQTAWERVDDVIVVSPDMRRRVLAAAPEIAVTSRLSLVCNGVDVERFVAPDDAERSPFRIGWCGLMTLRKNPTLALEVLLRLREIDARYHLAVCGMGGEPLARETFLHLARRLRLSDAIREDGRVGRADMPAWHARNGALLHTSLHEGLSCAVLEAAAAGCDLAVLDHPGAGDCWPAEMLFGAVDEAVALIRAARPGRWTGHVRERHPLDRQIAELAGLLNGYATGREARAESLTFT